MEAVAIRPFAPPDYDAFASVVCAANPEYPLTAQQMREQDAQLSPNTRQVRFVAEMTTGALVGAATLAEPEPESGVFYTWLQVLPSYQGAGIGKQLYQQVLASLAGFGARTLRASARGDKQRALRFLRERGFVEYDREHESKLDLAAFDPLAWEAALRRVEAQDVVLTTYAQLDADPAHDRKLHALSWAIQHADQPGSPPPDDDFARWQKGLRQETRLLPEAFVIAHDGERYLGQSNVLLMPGTTELETGWTAVLPAYRGRGLATALKVATLAWAKARGDFTAVRTWNNATNETMIGINQRLGFVPQPAWFWFERPLS